MAVSKDSTMPKTILMMGLGPQADWEGELSWPDALVELKPGEYIILVLTETHESSRVLNVRTAAR